MKPPSTMKANIMNAVGRILMFLGFILVLTSIDSLTHYTRLSAVPGMLVMLAGGALVERAEKLLKISSAKKAPSEYEFLKIGARKKTDTQE